MESANVISAGNRVRGNLTGTGPVVIAGQVQGDVTVQGRVAVDAGGRLEGALVADEVVIDGATDGSVHGRKSVKLGPTAEVRGKLVAAVLDVDAAATVAADIKMELDLPRGARRPQGRW